MVTKCGAICDECLSFKKECPGCGPTCGQVFWTKYIEKDVCPVYQCCEDKGISDCGCCPELPCQLWFALKDPGFSDEEHQASIDIRVKRLGQGK